MPQAPAPTWLAKYGVAYRKSKSMADRDEDNRGPDAGTKVTGLRDGGWIVVDVSGVGKRFLPIEQDGDTLFDAVQVKNQNLNIPFGFRNRVLEIDRHQLQNF